MANKKLRREKLPKRHSRKVKYKELKAQQYAQRLQPIKISRPTPDRPRIDNDPDPFAYKLDPQSIYPSYSFEEWPLHPGIRPDQFRENFTSDDIIACGIESNHPDYKYLCRALSYHNGNGKEINKQLETNEITRWGFHKYDSGNPEIQIAIRTLRLRRLKARMDRSSKRKRAKDYATFGKIYQKKKNNDDIFKK